MIGSFKFNNVESSYYDLVCKSVKRPLLPARKIKRVDLPGMSGAYDTLDDEYELRIITMKIQYIGTTYQELRTRARDIAAWLSPVDWSLLVLNDEDDKYYLAKVTNDIDLESLWESGSADIVFDCQPFACSENDVTEEFEDVTGGETLAFTNIGTRRIDYKSQNGSKFQISITGSCNNISLTLNGKTLTYNDSLSSETLIIDNIAMEATVGGVNVFSSLVGDFDTFLSVVHGVNSIVIGGSGINVDITVVYLPLWI